MGLDRELAEAFQTETRQLIQELIKVVERIKNAAPTQFPKEALAEFSQKIDRVMGTAKTFAGMDPENPVFIKIGKMAELCKAIGTKAAQRGDPKILKPVAVIWADVLKVLDGLVEHLDNPDKASQATKLLSAFMKDRLKWLSETLGIDLK